MPKKLLSYFINIAAVILIAFGVGYYLSTHHLPDSSSPPTQSTQAMFAASFHDVDGKSQVLNQWKGKLIVVNFWATWCPPCLEEMPELSRLNDKYHDRGLVVLGISTDELDKIRVFSKEHPVSYPLLAGNTEAMELGVSLGNDKGVLPYTVVIKPDGTIAKTYFGQVNQALLERTLLPLMASKTKL